MVWAELHSSANQSGQAPDVPSFQPVVLAQWLEAVSPSTAPHTGYPACVDDALILVAERARFPVGSGALGATVTGRVALEEPEVIVTGYVPAAVPGGEVTGILMSRV